MGLSLSLPGPARSVRGMALPVALALIYADGVVHWLAVSEHIGSTVNVAFFLVVGGVQVSAPPFALRHRKALWWIGLPFTLFLFGLYVSTRVVPPPFELEPEPVETLGAVAKGLELAILLSLGLFYGHAAVATRFREVFAAIRRTLGPIRLKRGLAAGAAIAIASAAAAAYFVAQPSPPPEPSAPLFVTTTTDGEVFELSQHFRFHPVVLSFLCIQSTEGQRLLNETLKPLRTTYSSLELILLTVDTNPDANDTIASVNAYRDAYGITWPFVIDDGSLKASYKVNTSIALFVIEKRGLIAFQSFGWVDFTTLKAAIDETRRAYAA